MRRTQFRIVSLAPSATSILCAIGAKNLLVGVTKWCAHVAPVKNLPQLGDCWHMNSVQEILQLAPTLVVGSVPYRAETVAKLLAQPITFLAMNPRTLTDIENDIRILGRISGRTVQAERLLIEMRQTFREIERRTRSARLHVAKNSASRKARVYCEAWPNPRISSPHWVTELVRICGGEMVVPPGRKVTEEQVAEANPDVIVLAWAATQNKSQKSKAYQVKAWREVTAIRNHAVYVIRDELLNTPGPPLLAGARELFRILRRHHPNGFSA
ncbi:MAG TPA: ABC transporter substrate-binding protein [Candidatus Dormibacteraeota bacterium]|nr:ABC transporter substrate-binding protein [Candidatus Dormibacteraeota bacterium]